MQPVDKSGSARDDWPSAQGYSGLMEWRTDPAILAFFVLVFLVSLPFALVKSRRHREETRAWLSGEDGYEPAETVPAGAVEPRRSLTREFACRVAGHAWTPAASGPDPHGPGLVCRRCGRRQT